MARHIATGGSETPAAPGIPWLFATALTRQERTRRTPTSTARRRRSAAPALSGPASLPEKGVDLFRVCAPSARSQRLDTTDAGRDNRGRRPGTRGAREVGAPARRQPVDVTFAGQLDRRQLRDLLQDCRSRRATVARGEARARRGSTPWWARPARPGAPSAPPIPQSAAPASGASSSPPATPPTSPSVRLALRPGGDWSALPIATRTTCAPGRSTSGPSASARMSSPAGAAACSKEASCDEGRDRTASTASAARRHRRLAAVARRAIVVLDCERRHRFRGVAGHPVAGRCRARRSTIAALHQVPSGSRCCRSGLDRPPAPDDGWPLALQRLRYVLLLVAVAYLPATLRALSGPVRNTAGGVHRAASRYGGAISRRPRRRCRRLACSPCSGSSAPSSAPRRTVSVARHRPRQRRLAASAAWRSICSACSPRSDPECLVVVSAGGRAVDICLAAATGGLDPAGVGVREPGLGGSERRPRRPAAFHLRAARIILAVSTRGVTRRAVYAAVALLLAFGLAPPPSCSKPSTRLAASRKLPTPTSRSATAPAVAAILIRGG